MKGENHMEKKHNFNLEDMLGNVEETFFTAMITVAAIIPFLYMFVK